MELMPILRITALLALVAAFTGCWSSVPAEKAETPAAPGIEASTPADLEYTEQFLQSERTPAPEFALKDANGATVTLAGYRGQVVLLNFWATWCVPCRAEMPWFQEFERSYKDRGFAVLGASMDEEGWGVVKPFVDEHKINYRMTIATAQMSELYGGIASLPTTFMIDREGRIAAIHTGLVSKSTYVKKIEELLENKNVAAQDPDDGGRRLVAGRRVRLRPN